MKKILSLSLALLFIMIQPISSLATTSQSMPTTSQLIIPNLVPTPTPTPIESGILEPQLYQPSNKESVPPSK